MADTQSLSRLARGGLYLTVFVTGAAVMVIELIGTRLIAPFYGASLYVWSSLISVTMIALAAGYFLGGWIADRAKRTGLSIIIALAGVTTLAIPWVTRPVLMATDSLGLRMGAFVSALILFSPTLTFLGMVGPGAIKLSTSQLAAVGTSAGSIYAVSTVGSVVGTLLLGFFLFPLVGSREILVTLGVVLLVLAVAVAWYEQKHLARTRALISSAALLIVGLILLPQAVDAGRAPHSGGVEIRSERESLYGWVRVIDKPRENLRLLTSDASTIGAASISTREGRLAYQDIVNLIPRLAPETKRALVIGLGAGHMATLLRNRYGIVTDTLEIDPEVADAAGKWFGFTPTGKTIVGDARYEIRRLSGPYNLIIHDCFTGGTEPAHLLTVEALSQLRGLLAPHGMLALNFVAFGQHGNDPALASVAQTVARVFAHYTVLVSEPGNDFNDFIFLASDEPIDFGTPSLGPTDAAWLKQRIFQVDATRGEILTDNFNPLEHLQTRKSEHYRRVVADWLGTPLLVR